MSTWPLRFTQTEVSPDGRILVVEHEYERHTPEQHTKLEAQAAKFGDPPPPEDTQITLLDVASREVLAALHTQLPVSVPITSTGYIGVSKDEGQDEFLVSFIPFDGQPVAPGQSRIQLHAPREFLQPEGIHHRELRP